VIQAPSDLGLQKNLLKLKMFNKYQYINQTNVDMLSEIRTKMSLEDMLSISGLKLESIVFSLNLSSQSSSEDF
jgi:hypothetical protein